MNSGTPAEHALAYAKRGWNPVPLPYKTKKPVDDGWQNRVIREDDVPRYFNGHAQNIGVIMGPSSGGLTDVDLDCPEAIAIAPFILPRTGAIFGRPSARAAHWLYKTDLATKEGDDETRAGDKAVLKFADSKLFRSRQKDKKATLVELRVGPGAQTVFPGSTHESGEAITWEEAGEPAAVDGVDLIKSVKLIAVGALFARYWPGLGARHDAALAVGGFMARAGYKPEWIKYFVERIAREAGCSDIADKMKAAHDSAINTLAGKKTFGLKKINEFFGDHVAEKAAEWMDYQGVREGDDTSYEPRPAADPVDLWANFDPPTLPRGILPDVIERFAFEQGRDMGADMAGIAMSALAVCAAAIPDKIKLQVKRHNKGWLESARIWVALVGPPSTMKSPIIAAAARPLRKIDSELARQYADKKSQYDKLPKEEKSQAQPPKNVRVMLQDTTIEAAQEVLKDSPDGVLCYQDELSGWFGSMEKYSNGKGGGRDRAFWLEAYNGGQYAVNRIGRGSTYIDPLSVSLLGGIQPEPIRKIADESTDDGLLQRLLPVILGPAIEGRDEEASLVVSEYSSLISRLHHLDNPMFGGVVLDFNMASPQGHSQDGFLLRFDDGAQVYRQELERKHQELQTCETVNRKLAAHIGKYNGIFVRLCVVWHCVESAPGKLQTVISENTARRVGSFLHGFLLPHAVAFYAGVLGLSNDHDRLAAVAGYILAHKLEKITNRDIQRGDQTMRGLNRREVESVFDQLDALGWINGIPGPRPTAPPHWVVNPAVHTKFAERATAEAKRRARTREMLAAMLGKGAAA
jgi:hypothetical protein